MGVFVLGLGVVCILRLAPLFIFFTHWVYISSGRCGSLLNRSEMYWWRRKRKDGLSYLYDKSKLNPKLIVESMIYILNFPNFRAEKSNDTARNITSCVSFKNKNFLLYNFRTSRAWAWRFGGRETASRWTGLLVDCGFLCDSYYRHSWGLFQKETNGVSTH